MIAQVGDRIVLETSQLGETRRVGVITTVGHADGAPPYRVRWLDTGHTTLIFPGAEARIEHPARHHLQPVSSENVQVGADSAVIPPAQDDGRRVGIPGPAGQGSGRTTNE